MNRLLWIIFPVLLITVNLHSQVLPLSIRVNAGVAHLPMTSWKSFVGHTYFPTDKYTTLNPTIFGGLSVHWRISEKHSVSLGTELLKPKIQWVGALQLTNEIGDTLGFSPSRIDWLFRTVPLTIGYEYKIGILKDKLEPVLGLGVSLMFSKLRAKVVSMSDIYNVYTSEVKRSGKGYGIDGALGFHNKINDHFSSIWQLRYRYSDGMYFTDDQGDIKVKFSGYYFSVGLEYGL